MKLKRKLALLLAFAMVITSVNVPEAAKKASAAVASGTATTVKPAQKATVGTGLTTVEVSVHMEVADITQFEHQETGESAKSVMLQCYALTDAEDDTSRAYVNAGQDEKDVKATLNKDTGNAAFILYLEANKSYTLKLARRTGDQAYTAFTETELSDIEFDTYVPAFEELTKGSAGNTVSIANGSTARNLSGKITGLASGTKYTLFVSSTSKSGEGEKAKTFTAPSSGEYDLSAINMAELFTSYTGTTDTVTLKLVKGEETSSEDKTTLLNDTYTFKWEEQQFATVTVPVAGQSFIMAAAEIPASLAESFGEAGKSLSYRVTTASGGAVCTYPASANAGESRFTKENGTYVNYTRISSAAIKPGTAYKVVLTQGGSEISNTCDATTAAENKTEIVKAPTDGTPAVFDATLYDRLLQLMVKRGIVEEDAKSFTYLDIEKLLNATGGRLDLGLPVNSQKAAVSVLTGFENIQGIRELSLANNNITNAQLETVLANLVYLSKIDLSGNQLTEVPNLTGLKNLGNPSQSGKVNLQNNIIAAAQFTKEAYSAKFDAAVIGKVKTNQGWSRVAQVALTQRSSAAPVVTADKQYTAYGNVRPLVVTVSSLPVLPQELIDRAFELKYYLTVKKGATVLKSDVIGTPDSTGKIKYVFTDLDKALLPDGDNELTFVVEPKNSNYASATVNQVVTYSTQAANLTVDEVRYGSVVVSGGVATSTSISRTGAFDESSNVYVEYSTNKKFRTSEKKAVTDYAGEIDATTIGGLEQNTTYFFRLVTKMTATEEDGETVYYPLTDAVKATTKKVNVTVKASKVKVTKGYNYNRVQSTVTVKTPKNGNIIVTDVTAGFYGNRGYRVASVGRTASNKWFTTYHINSTSISSTYKGTYKNVYAYVELKDLDTGDTFSVFLGDKNNKGLSTYKKVKGTIKVKGNNATYTTFAGTIKKSSLINDLDVYVKVSSSSAFDLPGDKENGPIYYANGKYQTTVSGLNAGSAYNAKLYVEKPDGTEYVLKKTTYTTATMPVTAALSGYSLAPGVANAVATVVVDTAVLEKDWAITDVEADFGVSYKENAKPDDIDHVKLDLDDPQITKSDDGKYTITAKFSDNVYPDKSNASATGPSGEVIELYRVYVQPKVTVTYENRRNGMTGTIVIDNIARAAADKLTDIDTRIEMTTLTETHGNKTDAYGDVYKFVKLNGQFAYGLIDGVTKYTGTSVANLGDMIEYQLKVYDKAAPEKVAVVSQSSLSALTEGMLEQEWKSYVRGTGYPATDIDFEAGHTYTFTISQITNVEGVEPVKELKSVDVVFAEETPTQAPDPTPAPDFNLNAITDANLKAAIVEHFGVSDESKITKTMVERETTLYLGAAPYTAEDKKIKSLAGIELFKNLQRLYLAGNAVTDIGGLNQIDTLKTVDFSYNNLTARPALNRVEGLNVILFGNKIPGENSQLGATELVMADVYYAVEEEDGADNDIESSTISHPFYFEVNGLDYANYELTLAIGTESFTDSISYSHSNLYQGYDAGDFIEDCIKKGVIVADTPVSVSVKLAKYTAADQAVPAETPLEVTKQVTFASAKKFTDVVVKNNTTITLGDKSYSAEIWAPNQTFFTKAGDLAADSPSVDKYDYLKVKENVIRNQYDGINDNDRKENYLDLNGKADFDYGNQVIAMGVKPGKTEPVKVYLLDAAGNRVLKCNVDANDCGIGTYTGSVYSVKFNSQSRAEDVLGQQSQLASHIDFSFDNTKNQFKNLKAGTYTVQYVLPNGTVGTAVTPITVKAKDVTEKEPVIYGIYDTRTFTPATSKKLRITLCGSEYDNTKVAPVIYTKQNGVMTAVGTMTGSKVTNIGSLLYTEYEFVNEAGWTKGNYYVGLKVADGYSVKREDRYANVYGFARYDYRQITLLDPATSLDELESGYNKADGSFYAVYDNAPDGAVVKAKLYKYPYNATNKYNQYVEGEAQTTVASGGSIVMNFTKDGAPVAYEYNVRYTAVYTIGDDTTVHEIIAAPLQTTFDITRVVDNIDYSGKDYYVQKGAKKVTLNAYMTTSLVSGKKVKAQLTDAYGYNVGSAVKLKVTKVKGTDYSKVSGTFGGKKTKLDYGNYWVNYYVGDLNVSDDIAYHSNSSAYDIIRVVDLGSADYYQTKVEAERNVDGSITVTADTLRAKSLNMKKFSVELYDDADDEEITGVKVSAKAKGKNQVVLTITGAEDVDSVYGYVKYKNKYPLNYLASVKNYEKVRFAADEYRASYKVDSRTEVSGKTKSTTVTVQAATAGAILRLYKVGTSTEVKAVSIEAIGVYTLKAADLAGVELGYEYDWVISDYKGVARNKGTDYFYAETPVTKTAQGAVTPVTSIQTDVKGKSVGVSVGAQFALNAYGAPARVTDTPVKYAISKKDKKVISITKDGVIKGKKVGKAVVTITSKDNKKVKTKITVTVGPKAAKLTSVKANKNGSVTVKWKKAKSSKKAKVAGYIISVSTSEDGTYKQVAKVSAKKSSATIKKGLKANKTYYFKVTAYAKSGKAQLAGSDSDAKSAKVKKVAKKSSKKSSKKKKVAKKSSKKKKK